MVNILADMSDLMKNFSSMMNGKEIPDNIKEMLNSFVSKSKNESSNTFNNASNNTVNKVPNYTASNTSKNTDNKEPLNNNLHVDSQGFNQGNSCNRSDTSSPFDGIDFDTMMKMQKIISSMNSSSNSSCANLLRSLKPYLKPSRQAKVDECIQLLSLEKAFSLMNNSNISNRW